MPCSAIRAAAASSCVESGLLAQSTRSAPPALSVMARLAVSVVICRQADMRMPLRGCSRWNRSRMSASTGMSLAAQRMRALPWGARLRSLTSPATPVVVVTVCCSLPAMGKNGAADSRARRGHGAYDVNWHGCVAGGSTRASESFGSVTYVDFGATPSSYVTRLICRVLRDALLQARQHNG